MMEGEFCCCVSRRVTKTFEPVFGVHVRTKRACAHFDKRAQDEQCKHQGIKQRERSWKKVMRRRKLKEKEGVSKGDMKEGN